MNSARLFVGEPKMADFADDVALLSGNGCCRVDRIACAGVENRGKKRNSTKRCGLDRLNLIYAKRAVAGPINGLIRYPRLVVFLCSCFFSLAVREQRRFAEEPRRPSCLPVFPGSAFFVPPRTDRTQRKEDSRARNKLYSHHRPKGRPPPITVVSVCRGYRLAGGGGGCVYVG